MGDRFSTSQLHGKLANIVTETAVGEKIDDAKLKSLVSGELQTAERKGKDHFEFRPYTTIWLATNHMPHTRDYSQAFFRRVEILTFPNTFEEDSKDIRLVEKLAEELPGILNLSLNAIAAVMVRGDFTQCISSQKARQAWKIKCDQVAAFVQECCKEDKDAKIPITDLYRYYREWSNEQGINRMLNKNCFSKRVTNLGFPSTRSNKTRYIVGLKMVKELQYYQGLDK